MQRLAAWLEIEEASVGQGTGLLGRRVLVAGSVLVMAILVAGCAADALDKSADFDRHRYSRVVQAFDQPDKIYFDVSFGADYPADDPAAEKARMAWLDAWLEQRRLCPSGHEVGVRRPFDYLEDNPAGYQQRWEIHCLPPGGRK